MKKNYYETGNRIRSLREEKHYTREKLAEKADLSPKFLYEIEIGIKGFSADTLCRLAEALDVNTDYILFGENETWINNKLPPFLDELTTEVQKDLMEILKLIHKITSRN